MQFIGLYRFFSIMDVLEEEYSFLEASNLYSLRLKTSCSVQCNHCATSL